MLLTRRVCKNSPLFLLYTILPLKRYQVAPPDGYTGSKKSTTVSKEIFENNMTRSIWKGPFSEVDNKKKANIPQKIWSRRSLILPRNIDRSFFIYNGKNFISIKIKPDMVGHKFGEFAITRRKPIHKSSKKKRK